MSKNLPKPTVSDYENSDEIFFLQANGFDGYYPVNLSDSIEKSGFFQYRKIYKFVNGNWIEIPELPKAAQ